MLHTPFVWFPGSGQRPHYLLIHPLGEEEKITFNHAFFAEHCIQFLSLRSYAGLEELQQLIVAIE